MARALGEEMVQQKTRMSVAVRFGAEEREGIIWYKIEQDILYKGVRKGRPGWSDVLMTLFNNSDVK